MKPPQPATITPEETNNEKRLEKSMQFKLSKTSMWRLPDGSLKEDIITLKLIVAGNQIGEINFDISKQAWAKRCGYRAIMAASATEARSSTDVNMVGNLTEWPDARLEFHVKVTEVPPERRRQSSIRVAGSGSKNEDAASEYSETSDAQSVNSMSTAAEESKENKQAAIEKSKADQEFIMINR